MATKVEKFESMYVADPNSGCWLWLASTNVRGYGNFCADGKVYRAHRWAYEALVGPVPRHLVLDHKCRVHCCVNPAHLEPVTQRENILRGMAPAALQAARTHCIHGHELSGSNLYVKPNGARQCIPCRRETDKRRPRNGN